MSDHVDLGTENQYHEWVDVGRALYLDTLARKTKHGGTTRWMQIICNNIRCPGEVLFNADAVVNEITQWMEK